MPRTTVVARLVFNRLPEIAESLQPRASQVVRKTASDLLAHAESNLPDSSGRGVDTGNLKNSYQIGDADNIFEMKPGSTKAVVGTSVEYAVYVEYGTRKMAAIPHLTPAVEAVRPGFEAAMQELLK